LSVFIIEKVFEVLVFRIIDYYRIAKSVKKCVLSYKRTVINSRFAGKIYDFTGFLIARNALLDFFVKHCKKNDNT